MLGDQTEIETLQRELKVFREYWGFVSRRAGVPRDWLTRFVRGESRYSNPTPHRRAALREVLDILFEIQQRYRGFV